MATTVEKQKTTLPHKVRKLEEAIITISGPALATSGIIAGIDIVTNGFIAKAAPAWGALAGLVWAVCLMLTLDFQVLTLGVRAHRVYASNKGGWRKAFEIVLCCAIAAALAYVSLQMGSIFSKMIGTTLSIDQAAQELGINVIALIYERSAMVMLLIFMSGWLRDTESGQVEQSVASQIATPAAPAAIIPPETINLLIERLNTLTVTVTQLSTPTSAPVPQIEGPKEPDALVSSGPSEQPESEQAAVEADAAPGPGEQEKQSYANAIEALYKSNPSIKVDEIVAQVGCSKSTAAKWLTRCKPAKKGS